VSARGGETLGTGSGPESPSRSAGPLKGLSLAPVRALRPAVDSTRLGRLLCPPYDVISERQRQELLAADPDNAVAVILPRSSNGEDPYQAAARRLESWSASGLFAVAAQPALYIYEMTSADGAVTRGWLGAVELRDPADSVILPHEDTMPGPVADRLALMTATEADLEPIYLIYDGGGAASHVVAAADALPEVASAVTPDGIGHRLWAVTSPDVHAEVDADLRTRRALIADGHHRYATYLERQRQLRAYRGAGPWDRGLSLLVDSSSYGPQVRAIHRVVHGLSFDAACTGAATIGQVTPVADARAALAGLNEEPEFAAVLTDGDHTAMVRGLREDVLSAVDEPAALARLDVTVVHRVLVARAWRVPDREDVVGYAHALDDAIAEAQRTRGVAVLLRPTPVAAVTAVAAAGSRMPRKTTLFVPKPASGLVMRRFRDQT
jgi:uncharacterized protein (DUF1015 family)